MGKHRIIAAQSAGHHFGVSRNIISRKAATSFLQEINPIRRFVENIFFVVQSHKRNVFCLPRQKAFLYRQQRR